MSTHFFNSLKFSSNKSTSGEESGASFVSSATAELGDCSLYNCNNDKMKYQYTKLTKLYRLLSTLSER